MLKVQEYLQSGKTFDDLTAELGIVVKKHDYLPLAILNYDQIESPKTHPIVRECRALVLRSDTYELAARSFRRFYNWGEVADEMVDFDFWDFVVESKEDGSLVLLYHIDGRWHANTRGSFALDNMQFQDFTWREGICRALGVKDLHELEGILRPDITYVCEFVSPWNKVVRQYDKPRMYLLAAFSGPDELHWHEVDALVPNDRIFIRPTRYEFKSVDEIQCFLQRQSEADPTFEGVVIRDGKGHRWKIKNPTYLSFHRMRGEGDNLFNPKHLLPFVLAGEEAELICYFPEVKEKFYEVKSRVMDAYAKLVEVWADHKDIADQKEFALAVKDKQFASVLFTTRKKYGAAQKSADLRREFREAESSLLKFLQV